MATLLGFGISLFLTISHYNNYQVPCDLTRGCEAVLNSKYSIFLGLPLALWGVGFYTLVIGSCLLANHYNFWRKALTWILGAGSLASLVFLALQFFVIKKVCQYCLVTDLLIIVLFLWDLNILHHSQLPENLSKTPPNFG